MKLTSRKFRQTSQNQFLPSARSRKSRAIFPGLICARFRTINSQCAGAFIKISPAQTAQENQIIIEIDFGFWLYYEGFSETAH